MHLPFKIFFFQLKYALPVTLVISVLLAQLIFTISGEGDKSLFAETINTNDASNLKKLKEVVITLSIQDYLSQVVSKNEAARESRLNVGIARARLHERRDRDSLIIGAGYNLKQQQSPFNLTNQNFKVDGSMGVLGLGTTLKAGVSNVFTIPTDTFFDPNSTGFSRPQSTWISTFSFDVTQPLLRNGLVAFNDFRELDALNKGIKLSKATYEGQLEQIVLEALSLLWQLELNQQNLTVYQQSLKDNEELFKQTKRLVQRGALDIADQYDTEALVTFSKTDVERTENQIITLNSRLAYYLGWDVTQVVQYKVNITNFNSDIDDNVENANLVKLEADLKEKLLYEKAIFNRKDYQQAKLNFQIKDIQLAIAYGYNFPILDLKANFNNEGRNDDLSKAYGNIEWSNLEKWNWSVGFNFSVPINPWAFITLIERPKVEREQAFVALKRIQKEIAINIEEIINNARFNYNKLVRNRDIYNKMRRKKVIYQRDFQSGKISLNTLVRANNDQRQWQQLYSSSVYEYRISLVQLEIACGTMLLKYNLSTTK